MRFRCDFMPWTRGLLEEYGRRRYRRFFLSGPGQGGKTLLGLAIPLMYHLFEENVTVILGVPDIGMAQGIYEEKVAPVIERSRYRATMPAVGSGSRGGKFLAMRFRNGAWLRFMGAGAGDEQRSSHTAPVVVITEIDKMDRPGKASRETDPVRQIEARTRAFGSAARVYAECTMSIEEGRVYREVVEWGTDSKIYHPCPLCGAWLAPEREHLVGWQGAEDVIAARDGARIECPECRGLWGEDERRAALERYAIVSKTQRVLENGRVEGPLPRTVTYGFRWTDVSSPMLDLADIAEAEHRAEISENPGDEKECAQFFWARPYREELGNLTAITRDLVLRKIGTRPKGQVPEDVDLLTAFLDLGLYLCWWTVWAWRQDAQGYLVDYGAIEVPQERQPDETRVLAAIRGWREDVLRVGWHRPDGKAIVPRLTLVDSAWNTSIAYAWAAESGQGVAAARGYGSAKNQRAWRPWTPGPGKEVGIGYAITRDPGGFYLVHLDADHWKAAVHSGFAAPSGAPGSLMLYKAEQREHLSFARQITAERLEEEWVPGQGRRQFWTRTYKHNHYLDSTAGARAAAAILGVSPVYPDEGPRQQRPRRGGVVVVKKGGSGKIRTRY